jgi:hypothetical protein
MCKMLSGLCGSEPFSNAEYGLVPSFISGFGLSELHMHVFDGARTIGV